MMFLELKRGRMPSLFIVEKPLAMPVVRKKLKRGKRKKNSF